MQLTRVGVFGASGYSGLELVRILERHPAVELVFASSERSVGARASPRLRYASGDACKKQLGSVSMVFTATPTESSLELVPLARASGVSVIDLSGAFRLTDASCYPTFYGFAHSAPELLKDAVYGLSEWKSARGATLVANPGCYATAVEMALLPLLQAHIIDARRIVVTAASGVSGAGRKATDALTFMEVDSDFRAYRTIDHQHLPEIRQTLATLGDSAADCTFVPHLLPMKRGVLATAVVRLAQGVSGTRVREILESAYANAPLVRCAACAEDVRIADVANTPLTIIGASTDGATAVITCAIDNLLKGAASQAVQNLNAMLDLPTDEGLPQ